MRMLPHILNKPVSQRTIQSATKLRSGSCGVLMVVVLLCCRCVSAQSSSRRLFHAVHPAMGSEFSIDLYAPDQETANRWMQESFDEIDRIDALLSNYKPTSELSRITREVAAHPVTTDPETFAFLQTCVAWSRRTQGAFDITVDPLMHAWGFFQQGHVPFQAELDHLRASIGWDKIVLDPAKRTVWFRDGAHLALDPGGIGKGYAVDRVVALLRKDRVTAALISAGSSSIYAMGAPNGAKGWRIDITDPAKPANTLSTVYLRDASLSTSACTKKFFIKDGHRFCHILDPHTERPVEDMLQTTVIAPIATDTDALSTASFVLGAQGTRRLLDSLANTHTIVVSGTTEHPQYDAIHWTEALHSSK